MKIAQTLKGDILSEKRFWKMKTFQGFCDIFDNEKTICSVKIEYADTLLNLLNSLSEENEKLRQTINEVIELLLEEVDLFSDKATEHDIIAYKELNQFDNKDAYSMCISTKKAIKMLQRCL